MRGTSRYKYTNISIRDITRISLSFTVNCFGGWPYQRIFTSIKFDSILESHLLHLASLLLPLYHVVHPYYKTYIPKHKVFLFKIFFIHKNFKFFCTTKMLKSHHSRKQWNYYYCKCLEAFTKTKILRGCWYCGVINAFCIYVNPSMQTYHWVE